MATLSERFKIPTEIMAYVANGFLEFSREIEAEATVQFAIPARGYIVDEAKYKMYTLVWIDPDRNAEFCHEYVEEPGDLPNFFVEVATPRTCGDWVPDLETVEDLESWLQEKRDRYVVRQR